MATKTITVHVSAKISWWVKPFVYGMCALGSIGIPIKADWVKSFYKKYGITIFLNGKKTKRRYGE